jgi:hypothetical protein
LVFAIKKIVYRRAYFQIQIEVGTPFIYLIKFWYEKCNRAPLKPLEIHKMSVSSPNIHCTRKMHVDSTIK